MKKAAILSITAFYLLLTTGTFVCMVHCAVEKLVSKTAMAMAHGGPCKMKDRKGPKNCGCCKKHGSYVVKENIKPAFDLKPFEQAAVLYPVIINKLLLPPAVASYSPETNINAPPGISGKAISIQFHSLQI